MDTLDDISVGELQTALQEVEGKLPAQRLIAAIAYKNGVSVDELAEWFDVEPATVSSWFTHLEQRPLDYPESDSSIAEGPRRLTDDELEQLAETVENPPSEVGFPHSNWNSGLITRYIREEFGVEYPVGRGNAWAKKAREHVRDS